MGNDIQRQLEAKIAELEAELEMVAEVEKDAWPGSPIEITQLEMPPDTPYFYLVEVPPADYEEEMRDPWKWVDTVLADTAIDIPKTIKGIDEQIAALVTERASLGQRVSEIIGEIKLFEESIAKLIEAGKEVEWIKPIRDVLLPHADAVRNMLDKLGKRVTKVGLTREGRVTWSWDDVDSEVPDQAGVEMDVSVDLNTELQCSLEAITLTREFLERREAILANLLLEQRQSSNIRKKAKDFQTDEK